MASLSLVSLVRLSRKTINQTRLAWATVAFWMSLVLSFDGLIVIRALLATESTPFVVLLLTTIRDNREAGVINR